MAHVNVKCLLYSLRSNILFGQKYTRTYMEDYAFSLSSRGKYECDWKYDGSDAK